MRWALRALATGSLLAASLLPAPAFSHPTSVGLDLMAGSERIVRSYAQAISVDDSSVVEAELLSSREILLVPKKAGRALVFLLGEGRLDAVRVRVRDAGGKLPERPASEAELQAARKACPRLKVEPAEEGKGLSAEEVTPDCRLALLALFASDDFAARSVSLMFTGEAIQAQLADIQGRMRVEGIEGLSVAYSGPVLRLAGKARLGMKMKLVRLVYEATVGPVLFEDRSELEPEPAARAEAAAATAIQPAPDAPQIEIVPMPPEEKAREAVRKRGESRR